MSHYRITIKNSKGAVKQVVSPDWYGLTIEQVDWLSLGFACGAAQAYQQVFVEVLDVKTGEIVFNKECRR
jgi:hypothetical protein